MAITRVTGSKWLKDLSVTEAKLADDAVTRVKIVDSAVDGTKIDTTSDVTINTLVVGDAADANVSVDNDGQITATTDGKLSVVGLTSGTEVLSVDGTSGAIVTSNNVTVNGDLTVNGTTTTVNSETLDVEDKNITVGKGGTVATADGSGLTVDITDGTAGSLIYKASSSTKWAAGDTGAEINLIGETGTATIFDKTYDLVGDDIQGKSDIEAALRELDSLAGAVNTTFYGDNSSSEVSADGLTITIGDIEASDTAVLGVYASGIRLSLGTNNDYTVDASGVITLAEALDGNIVVDYKQA